MIRFIVFPLDLPPPSFAITMYWGEHDLFSFFISERLLNINIKEREIERQREKERKGERERERQRDRERYIYTYI